MGQPLWRTVWRLPKKLKTELPYDSAVPLLGIYLEKNMVQKDTCTPMLTAALFTIPNEELMLLTVVLEKTLDSPLDCKEI